MKFRSARHTHVLQPIIDFYVQIIGLEVLGKFENHQGYDGVFIGLPDALKSPNGWHLEFTVSWEPPLHRPDEDDLLVFYPETSEEFEAIIARAKFANIKSFRTKNPYWRKNGVAMLDPDGFGVVIVDPNLIV